MILATMHSVVVAAEARGESESPVELSPGAGPSHGPAVPHERLVMPHQLGGMLQLPAIAAEVLEARQIPKYMLRSRRAYTRREGFP